MALDAVGRGGAQSSSIWVPAVRAAKRQWSISRNPPGPSAVEKDDGDAGLEHHRAAVARDRDQPVGVVVVEVGPFGAVGEADDAGLVPADQAAAAGGGGVVADAGGDEVGVDGAFRLKAATGEEADLLFLQLMGVHHEGGLHMALDALARAETDEARTLAESIVKSQQFELDELRRLEAQLTAA